MRLALAAALVTACGLFTVRAQDDSPRAAKLKTIQKAYNDEFDAFLKKLQGVKTRDERAGVISEGKENVALAGEKLARLVEENPKDDVALEAARFGITKMAQFGADGPSLDKMLAAVTAHHLNNAKVGELIMVAPQMGPAGEKLLAAAAEKSTDKKTKGMALYFLGTTLAEQADGAPNEKTATELTAKAIDYLEKAAKDAGDVPVGPSTIGKMAADDLTALKTLGIGKVAPDVVGTGLKDEKTKLSSLKGKVVLLDIWATWCPPCRAMIPHERELVTRMKGKAFELVSVSADDKKETLTEFLKETPMPWTHWWAGRDSEILRTFRVKAFPTLYLIDARGVIRKKWIGSPDTAVLDREIEALVNEAGRTN